ncbi:acetylglutamate kinase [Neobacillus bataviensis]|uniref:acetylglutamate kinase n=1 Tax=Neobacillus bataviensis TaxID=220685 RepID=UPI001CBAD0E7|nr:acetylglutamate kinase [Neobacillus bataviensis]
MRYIVIKCGGSVLDELSSSFFTSISELQNLGFKLVFVHGGGPDINEMLELFKIEPHFVNGLRKTDQQTLKIAEIALIGHTNRKLVEMLQQHNFNAIGIHGSDGYCLQADYINMEELGYVGEIIKVNTQIFHLAMNGNYIPVVTPIGITKDGQKLNINADYAAAEVAKTLHAEQCLFVTNVDGVFIDGSVASSLSQHEVNAYIEKGEISGGMIPKVQSALNAVEKGVESVMIVSGKIAFFENGKWHGTRIFQKEPITK